jgi:hypothetical protein
MTDRTASKRPPTPAQPHGGRRQPWFTADTHFGHAGAIGRFKRPFRSVAEMDDWLD